MIINLKKIFSISFFSALAVIQIASHQSISASEKSDILPALEAAVIPVIEVKNLDNLWENREKAKGEEELRAFVQKHPQVPENFDIAWRIARLVYFAGNFGNVEKLTRDDKISLFKYGYQAGLKASSLNADRVEGYYWYAVNLGSYGLAKGIFSALGNAKAGRDALLLAAKIDPTYQWAGPYRILGRYYQEVPGGIISFGDKKIAEDYFNQAIKIAPNFRLNTMYLGVLKEKKGSKDEALALFKQAKTLPNTDGYHEEVRYAKELDKNIKNIEMD